MAKNSSELGLLTMEESLEMNRTVLLGDIAEVKNGKSNTQDAVRGGQFLFFDRSQEVKRSNRYLFNNSAVILPGEGKEFVPRFYEGKYDLHQRAYAIYPKSPTDLDARYLYYVLLAKRNYFAHTAVGSTVKSLRKPTIERLSLPLPDLDQQKGIARILGDLDAKIELNRRMNETLEKIGQTLFKHYFIYNPDRKNWKRGRFGEIAAIVTGKQIDPSNTPDAIFAHYSLPAFDNGRTPIPEQGREIRSSKFRIPTNVESILLSKLNPKTPRIWLPFDEKEITQICSTEFLVLIPDGNYRRYFLYAFCASEAFQDLLLGIVSGTTNSHQRVRPVEFLNLTIEIPPSELALKFNFLTEPLYKMTQISLLENEKLKNLRDSLLPRLMRGNIDHE